MAENCNECVCKPVCVFFRKAQSKAQGDSVTPGGFDCGEGLPNYHPDPIEEVCECSVCKKSIKRGDALTRTVDEVWCVEHGQ